MSKQTEEGGTAPTGELAEKLDRRVDAADFERAGLSKSDLVREMQHPKAAAMVATLLEREATSITAGGPAPDFTLPRLVSPSTHGVSRQVTLSDHFGDLPVALVFGSYT
jgi:hypothetical protein